ncbi:molybdenum ABC transporter substrate-binding protein [Serratia fonticola]|uniref:substrate-binding domain-containing protein n=1 Tax=Serratia fonticola TaxID=47917 RepID=UPI000BFBA971|nr:substrate-binding domain-containing protein [Serratia fonticola]ATM74709.1 molybdenum ABC transporter substrate-binding protein [Serratia fonticola]
MNSITLFAAGSLRLAFIPLLAAFEQESGYRVEATFGPAGMLRERIEQGERPQVFASANLEHPQRLVALDFAQAVQPFTRNRLCATVRNIPELTQPDLLTLLCDPQWRVGISTPVADPSGDYAQQLFERLEQCLPGQGSALRSRAVALVGGPDSAPIPAGRLAAEYLLAEGLADIFLGYASYANALAACVQVKVRRLPTVLDFKVTYGLCLLNEGSVAAQALVAFILGVRGQRILQRMGMLVLD